MSLRNCTDQLVGLAAVGSWAGVAGATSEGGMLAAVAEPVSGAIILSTALVARLRETQNDDCAKELDRARKAVEKDVRAQLNANPEFEGSVEKAFAALKTHLPEIRPSIEELVSEWRLDPETVATKLIERFEEKADSAIEGHVARGIVRETIVRAIAVVKDSEALQKKLQSAITRQMLADLGWLRETVGRIDETTQRTDATTQRIEALVLALAETQRQQAEAVGINEDVVIDLARRINEHVSDAKSALAELSDAVDVAIKVQERGERASNEGGFVDHVLKRVAELSRKQRYLEAAKEAESAFEQWQRDEQERQQAEKVKGLSLVEAAAGQFRLQRNAKGLAEVLIRKIALEEGKVDFDTIRPVFGEHYSSGSERGVNFDLEVAIELGNHSVSASMDDTQRGKSLNNLGVALQDLGERESGKKSLEAAVAAHEEALKIRTRDRAPLGWAISKNNLGDALRVIGEREGDTEQLEAAAAAFQDALEVRTREQTPQEWGMTKHNLGIVLKILGERESDTQRIELAVSAYEDALKERTRERAPMDWAMTKNNLGNALRSLGEREDGTERLEAAIVAYEDALTEYKRERVPLQWAMTKNNLGKALRALGEREGETKRLEAAVEAYEDALNEWTREHTSLDWAMSWGNQGNALRALAELTNDQMMARRAVKQLNKAFETCRDGGHEVNAKMYKRNLEKAEALVARLEAGE
ncbi:MAG: tetratricopeptide repeat protein [Pseudomonadota bacterium]